MKKWFFLCLFVSASVSPIAHAQTASLNSSAQAEALFQRGVTLYKEATTREEALNLWQDALTKGSGAAGFMLGQVYENRAINQPQQADSWYQKAIAAYEGAGQLNHAGALNNLGALYFENNGTTLTPEAARNKAADYYRRAAKLGNSEAQYNLALVLARQQATAETPDEWQMWFERAANNGLVRAQAQLGQLQQALAESPNSSLDARRSLRESSANWLRKAAEAGDANGQFYYGVALQKAWGVPRDLEAAVQWFERASAQNYAAAQLELGRCYAWGLGVTSSNEKAREYYILAKANGAKEAITLLNELKASLPASSTSKSSSKKATQK